MALSRGFFLSSQLLRHQLAFFFRTFLRIVVKLLFSVKVQGIHNFPTSHEKTVIIANHQSPLDSFFLYLFLPQPPLILVLQKENKRFLERLFHYLTEHIIIDPLNPNCIETVLTKIETSRQILIFPEGGASHFNSASKVYEHVETITKAANASILPVAIGGLNYCLLGSNRNERGRNFFPKVSINILSPRALEGSEKVKRLAEIKSLLLETYYEAGLSRHSLFSSLARSAKTNKALGKIVEDITGVSLSYRQLLTKVFALASILQKLSASDGRIGIMLPNTCAGVVTFFACQLLGKQTCMINYTSGAKSITSAINFASIDLVISSKRFVNNADLQKVAEEIEKHTRLFYLEEAGQLIGVFEKVQSALAAFVPLAASRQLYREVEPTSEAVILFTSGSEGDPKAVVLSHQNLLSNLSQVKMLIELKNDDYILNALPFFHCFGLMAGMLLPLIGGTRIYEYPNPLHYRIIPELCFQKKVTCLWGTPTFLRGYGMAATPIDMYSLRFVVSGAEKLSEEIYDLWNDKFGIRIFQGYGVTEASPVIATNYPNQCMKNSVGQLVSQIEHRLRPIAGIPDGGELVVRGPNIMQGYLAKDYGGNDFLRKPETEELGTGWYATGDVVKIDENGFLTIVGRIKRFAKIAGEMVSLTAVEELAAKVWPDAQHAAITQPDPKKGEKIILITNQESAEKSSILKLGRELDYGDFYIPSEIKSVPEIPVLGSGKTNYVALEKTL